MWEHSCSKVYSGITKEAIWHLWSDVNNWHKYDPDIEYAKMDSSFEKGNFFILKPKGTPFKVNIQLVDVQKYKSYTDCTKFFGAKMYGMHEMHQEGENIRLSITMKVTGPLSWLWRKLVAEGVAKSNLEQMDNLAHQARLISK